MALLQDTNIWVLISFLLFVGVMARFAFGHFLKMLDGKIEKIRHDIDNAESLRVEAQELLAQYQRKQRDAAHEAEQIVANARSAAEMIRKDAEGEIDAMIARKEAQLADRLQRMEDTARAEIQAYAAELAVKATTEIIAAQLDQTANDRLIDNAIRNVGTDLK